MYLIRTQFQIVGSCRRSG